jgi:hypothetical protein
MLATTSTDYSPLQWCAKSIQDFSDLLVKFQEMDEALKYLEKLLGNGNMVWHPPCAGQTFLLEGS